MATITTLAQGAGATTTSTRYWKATPVLHSVVIDLAEAIVAKGSALAAADIIEAIRLPAGTILLAAGCQVVTAMTGTSTDAAVAVEVAGTDWATIANFDGAAAGAYAVAAASQVPTPLAATDTVDFTISAQTGTILTGKVRVYALTVDASGHKTGALAQVGD